MDPQDNLMDNDSNNSGGGGYGGMEDGPPGVGPGPGPLPPGGQFQPPPRGGMMPPPSMMPPPHLGPPHPPMGPPPQMMGPPGMGMNMPPPGMGMGPPPGMGMGPPPGMGMGPPPGMPPPSGMGQLGMNQLPPGMGPPPPPPVMGPPNMSQPPPGQGSPQQPPQQQQPPPQRPKMADGPPGEEEQQPLPSLMSVRVERPPPQVLREDQKQNSSFSEKDQKLPHALEKVLALKTLRASELGIDSDAIDAVQVGSEETRNEPATPVILQPAFDDIEDYEDDDDDRETITKKKKKDSKKKLKNKRKKKKNKSSKIVLSVLNEKNLGKSEKTGEGDGEGKENDKEKEEDKPDVEVEYIQEKMNLFELEPQYRSFSKIFEIFRIAEPEVVVEAQKDSSSDALAAQRKDLAKVPKLPEDDDLDDPIDKVDDDKPKLSKRKLKKLTRLSIAELKQLVNRPDVVEMHDVTARDPKLLVQLKAHRNTVPVPRHWCFKRKYLQGKRGIEKPPFDLPDFIKKTGIMEMRSSLQDKEEQKTLKAKMRERARPKMGKIDIDYQKLHDAFFKWQTKPRLTIHGDLYYEGKEFETRLKEKKPGDLSAELRTALGMPVGPTAHKVPPPWLIAMQRYGPPPSYPSLKIPGLNCPIPEGCQFGYHAGGWGKPPVDETGKPLYGDVFATHTSASDIKLDEDDVEKTIWGELESDSEEESEEEEDEDDEETAKDDTTGLMTPSEGLITPSGIASIPTGMETPDIIELRKKKIEAEMEGGETPALYQVLAEKRVERIGSAMMASTHVYDVGSAALGAAGVGPAPGANTGLTTPGPRKDTVELALDPSELDLDTEAMAARYEQQMREQQSHLQKEDLSDMLAEHVQRQKNKRKKQQSQDGKPTKKYKEFKF